MNNLKSIAYLLKMSTTLIKNLNTSEEVDNTISDETDVISLSNTIIDMSYSLKDRISAIETLYKEHGENECNEIVNRLSTLYQFSGTKLLEKYLYEISTNSNISTVLKIVCAKSICFFDLDNIYGFNALDIICMNLENVPTPCQIEVVCLLMCNKKFKDNSNIYFCNIINNNSIDCDYRYKTILSLESKSDILYKLFFIKHSSIQFLNNPKNMTMYRILAGQLLIRKCDITIEEREHIELTIMSFAQDSELDYNLRADAADVILQLGLELNKINAREIIVILGRHGGDTKTIFDNAQNVHIKEIEDSVLKGVEFLSSIDTKRVSNNIYSPIIDYNYVKKQIKNILKSTRKNTNKEKYKKTKDSVCISMNRIFMDRAIYGKYNLSLNLILLKVWTYICSHKSSEEMKTRLIEELVDMSNTCSSGFASRLINVISGFGDFNLTISWKDQIISNLTGRLNSRARDLSNPDKSLENAIFYNSLKSMEIKCDCCKTEETYENIYKNHTQKVIELLEMFGDDVLEEMTVTTTDYSSRKNFLTFFRLNIPTIRNELYEEFKEYITDTDFDLYIRYAISNYETGEFV